MTPKEQAEAANLLFQWLQAVREGKVEIREGGGGLLLETTRFLKLQAHVPERALKERGSQ